MNRVWVVDASGKIPLPDSRAWQIAPRKTLPEIIKALEPHERILLLAPQAELAEAGRLLGRRLLAARVLDENPTADQMEFLLHAVSAEARLQHDLEAAESIAWTGVRGSEEISLEFLGRVVLEVSACRDREAVEEALRHACDEFAPCAAVAVRADPPYLPAQDLGKYQLAVPVHQGGELKVHIYVRFLETPPQAVIERAGETLLNLGEAVALAVERNRMIRRAEQTKAVWEASFDAVEDPVAILDRNFRVVRANRAYGQLAGIPIDKVRGQICDWVEPGKLPTQEMLPAELELERNERFYRVYLDPIPAAYGAGRIVLRLHDITRERDLTERILAREQGAEMGILAASVAHEINNPVGGILAFAQMLLKDMPADSPLRGDVEEIHAAANRCKRIVQSLLGLVRKAGEDKTEVDLALLITEALALLEPEALRHHVRISWSPPHDRFTVMANGNRLQQAILHLLQQSLHAVAERKTQGKFNASLQVLLERGSQQSYLRIRDNGARSVHGIETASSIGQAVARMILEEYQAKSELLPAGADDMNEQRITFANQQDSAS